MFELFVGWDWGGTAHDVTVIDSAGERVHRMAIPHTEDGIARAVAKLADYGDRSGCRWRSKPLAGWSWIGCWPPDTQ